MRSFALTLSPQQTRAPEPSSEGLAGESRLQDPEKEGHEPRVRGCDLGCGGHRGGSWRGRGAKQMQERRKRRSHRRWGVRDRLQGPWGQRMRGSEVQAHEAQGDVHTRPRGPSCTPSSFSLLFLLCFTSGGIFPGPAARPSRAIPKGTSGNALHSLVATPSSPPEPKTTGHGQTGLQDRAGAQGSVGLLSSEV